MVYSPELALHCARLSMQVYSSRLEDSEEIAADPNQAFFSNAGSQVWLINEPGHIMIVFRGTSYEDILTDLHFHKETLDCGKVHRGFYAYALKVTGLIALQLQEWDAAMSKPVILTGHSLGATAAVLQAWWCWSEGREIGGVYTYGEPRIGNARFAGAVNTAFGDVHFRHMNGLDGVPMVPPWHWGYRHCGKRYYFSTDRQRLIRNAPLCQIVFERLPILLKQPWKWGRYKIVDHAIAGYVSACEKNLEV